MAHENDWAEATEQQILDAALKLAPAQGWTWPMARAAGKACGLTGPETELLLPHGPADLAALLSRRHDAQALARLAGTDPASLKIRARIRAGVEARLDAAAADEGAVRRWAGWLALPLNIPLALRLLWESADALWRWAGDTATDENHYSKRAILSGILASALAIRLASGKEGAMAFVDGRIENVMAYETWKAGLKGGDLLRDVAAALGKMRYG
ncbi:COQ9 family protein [Phenylobacterium sp.]|uniref:COQ9 family protein n=1 Tax=Phenylobacterium sp. TaxID=1871053 RepID=UPI002717814D|nr:COQ9 family protein [Phenylobacterium sp.]MDO8378179.1 COQ9 family protein [Phenylobacterium sp.]